MRPERKGAVGAAEPSTAGRDNLSPLGLVRSSDARVVLRHILKRGSPNQRQELKASCANGKSGSQLRCGLGLAK